MEVNNVKMEISAVKKSQYPTGGKPEIAFVGKSNVGKSSLINTLVNRKAIARTSQTPGKTRTINFYNVEELLYFVDLPGYGYAKLSKSESDKWGKMIEGYLKNRDELKKIVLLLDIRHEPGKNDIMMFEWLRYYEKDIIIAATKADKISRQSLPKNISVIRKTLNLTGDEILQPFSSVTKQGKDELWSLIDNIIN